MNAIRGEFDVEVAGEKRTIVCDMQAAEALFQSVGPHWLLWLYERFLGKPDKLADGTKIRRMEPLSPRDLVTALYGMLATDREKTGRTETLEDLFGRISPFKFHELQGELSKAVLASVGVPGEVLEAEAAAAAPPGNEPAAMPGTGAQL
jgi:hypothetical protein